MNTINGPQNATPESESERQVLLQTLRTAIRQTRTNMRLLTNEALRILEQRLLSQETDPSLGSVGCVEHDIIIDRSNAPIQIEPTTPRAKVQELISIFQKLEAMVNQLIPEKEQPIVAV
jgi:hypothetical protein